MTQPSDEHDADPSSNETADHSPGEKRAQLFFNTANQLFEQQGGDRSQVLELIAWALLEPSISETLQSRIKDLWKKVRGGSVSPRQEGQEGSSLAHASSAPSAAEPEDSGKGSAYERYQASGKKFNELGDYEEAIRQFKLALAAANEAQRSEAGKLLERALNKQRSRNAKLERALNKQRSRNAKIVGLIQAADAAMDRAEYDQVASKAIEILKEDLDNEIARDLLATAHSQIVDKQAQERGKGLIKAADTGASSGRSIGAIIVVTLVSITLLVTFFAILTNSLLPFGIASLFGVVALIALWFNRK